jgi:hypothetical protein
MGVKSLAFVFLPLAVALSGCTSTSTEGDDESKTKLIEYELCLEIQKEYWKNLNENFVPQVVEELALESCADKRP